MKEFEIDIIPGTDLKIIQDRARFSYGIDAILLSSFSKLKGTCIDLGCGFGIAALRAVSLNGLEDMYGVELQPEVASLARKSVELNELRDRVHIIEDNLINLDKYFKASSVDSIITNPPYIKRGKAIINPDENFAISRHEIACEFKDITSIAASLLKPLGKLVLVHRPDRLAEIIHRLIEDGLEPKRLRLVQSRLNKKPNLFLLEAVKGANPELKLERNLIIYDENGKYTDEALEFYQGIAKAAF